MYKQYNPEQFRELYRGNNVKFRIGQFNVEISINMQLEGGTFGIKVDGILLGSEIDAQVYYTPNGTVPLFVNIHSESEVSHEEKSVK